MRSSSSSSSTSRRSSSRDEGTIVLGGSGGGGGRGGGVGGSGGGGGGAGGVVPTAHFLRPLRPSTTYSLSLRACNAIGWGQWSSPASFQTTKYPSEVTSMMMETNAAVLSQRG
jgi:hypothetical protein